MSQVPIYTPGWRKTKRSKVPGLRKRYDGRGLNPGLQDLEFEVFTSWLCCGSILSLVQIFFSFVSNSLSCYYHTLPYPKTKEKKIWTKDKIEPQQLHTPPLVYLFKSLFYPLNLKIKIWILLCCPYSFPGKVDKTSSKFIPRDHVRNSLNHSKKHWYYKEKFDVGHALGLKG